MSASFFSFIFIEIKRRSEQNSLAFFIARMENLTEKWGKSEKTRDSQRRPGRQGKEKGTALERRADKRVPPPPPFSIPRFANRGWDGGALGSSHSPRPTSVWSLACQGLVNPSPGRRRHRAELLGPRLAQRQCS